MHTERLKQKKAIILRRQGLSYNQISCRVHISKSTCSLWLKQIKLGKLARLKLNYRSIVGRRKSLITRKLRRQRRDKEIEDRVRGFLGSLHDTTVLYALLCAMLYWAEGAKRTGEVRFINSDPVMVKLFLYLFRQSFTVDENKFRARLHLHSYHDVDKQKRFWSEITDIDFAKIKIYKKANSGKVKRPNYPGCISVNYGDIKIFKTLTSYYQLYAQRLGA